MSPGIKSEYLTPGEKFGDYQVMQCLAIGLFGGLYRMQHIRELHEDCILVLPKGLGEDPQMQARLQAFMDSRKTIQHDNFLTVERFEEIGGRPCLMMEGVEGVNLNEYLESFVRDQVKMEAPEAPHAGGKKQPPQAGLQPSVAKDLLKQIVGGMHFAHNAGVLHLNLNPGSLLIAADGHIKIVGLGLSALAGKEFREHAFSHGPMPAFSTSGNPYGPVDPISPELRQGGAGDVRSDVYALGQCAFYMLTGTRPGISSAYKAPSKYSAAIPERWDALVAKCLNPDPSKRYAGMDALLKDIEAVDKGESGGEKEGRGKSAKSAFGKLPMPGKAAVRVAAILVVGAALLAAGAWVYKAAFSGTGGAEARVFRVVEGQAPMLSLDVAPPVALVAFDGAAQQEMRASGGVLDVAMPEGIYTLTVSAPDHISRVIGDVGVKRGATRDLSVELQPAYGVLQVKSLPGAVVSAQRVNRDVEEIGIVGPEGMVEIGDQLVADSYTITVSADRFQPVILEGVTITQGKATPVEATLLPMPATVKVTTTPPGATIIVNDKAIGNSPVEAGDIPVDEEVRISAELEGYRTAERTITYAPGVRGTLDFGVLERRSGTVMLELTVSGEAIGAEDRAKLSVLLGGKEFPLAEGMIKGVPEGIHSLEIKHPDYKTFTRELPMKDRQTVALRASIEPKPGRLKVNVPGGLPFTLNSGGRSLQATGDAFEIAPNKALELTVAVKDHLLARRTMRLEPNQDYSWDVELVPIPAPAPKQDWTVPYTGIVLAWIAPGTGQMGSLLKEQARLPNEGPVTQVKLSRGFWMARHEVTQGQYLVYSPSNPSAHRSNNSGKHPVESVSYQDATIYCENLTRQERAAGRLPRGYEYRLPTEAEWEYACRAGVSHPFSWGGEADPSQGNFQGLFPRERAADSSFDRADHYGTRPVGSYMPNDWGLYDMHGNVREWCLDYYESRHPGGSKADYAGPRVGGDRVTKGGGWEDFAKRCRSAARDAVSPRTTSKSLGFRVVLAPVVGE